MFLIFFFLVSQISGFAQTPAAGTTSESAPVPVAEPTPASPPPAPEWKPILKWTGDLRYRLTQKKESIDEERKYQQLRARLGLRADVNDKTQAVIRLATATSPITTNQTLGDSKEPGMARRSFGIDLAYVDWKFLEPVSLWAGRTANPFWLPGKTQIVWDGDLAFEGLSLKYEPKSIGLFVNLGTSMISENYQAASGGASGMDSVDTGMAGGQIGYLLKKDDWSLGIHFSNFYFLNVQNSNITRFDKDAKIDVYSYPYTVYNGNSVYVNDPLLPSADRKYFFSNQYILLESGVEFKHKLGAVEYAVFADFVENDAVQTRGKAMEYGLSLKWIGITAAYAQIKKESDSVIGALTDSDSNGGGTDNEGYRITLAYEISKNAMVQVNQSKATRGLGTVKRDYSATLADLLVSF